MSTPALDAPVPVPPAPTGGAPSAPACAGPGAPPWAGDRNAPLVARFTSISRALSVAIFGIGTCVLAGYALGIQALTRLSPTTGGMAANTAAGFVLLGLALCLQTAKTRTLRHEIGARACAAVVLLLGAATLGEYLFGWMPDIDQLLFNDIPGNLKTAFPGRMAEGTALSLMLLGAALQLVNARQPKARLAAQALTGAVLVYALTGLYGMGLGQGAAGIDRIAAYAGIAYPTLVALVLLCGAVLMARLDTGPLALVAAPGIGGRLLRRLLPFALLVPPVIGWLRLRSDSMGHIPVEGSMALVALANMSVIALALWFSARWLERLDRQRVASEAALVTSEDTFRYVFEHSLIGKSIMQLDGTLQVNAALCEMLGRSPAEMARARWEDVTHPDDIEPQQRALDALVGGAASMRLTKRYLHKNGAVVWADVATTLRRDAQGRPRFFLTSVVDISARRLAEQVLRDANRHTRSLIEASVDPLLTVSPDGLITDANEAMCRVTGMTRDTLVGTRFSAYATQPDAIRESFREVLGTGQIRNHPATLRHRDGGLTDVLISASTYRSDDGTVLGVFAAARDIGDFTRSQAALRASEERSRATFEQTALGFALVSPTGRLEKANGALCELLGYERDELLKRSWPSLTDVKDQAADRVLMQQLLDGEIDTCSVEKRLLRHDGTPVWVNLTSSLVRTDAGSPAYFIDAVEDISARRLAQDRVRELNATLEQRVRVRTEQLESAHRDLEGFSYSVSHDLRAPLRAIDSFSNILLEDYSNALDEEGRRLLQTVRRNADRMAHLIDDILAFSRAGRGEIALSSVDVAALAREVLTDLVPPDGEPRIDVRIGELPRIAADKPMLRQVLTNLLSNAIKFTGKRDQPVIEIFASPGDGETVFSVRDNGAGFDPTYAAKLFGVFERLHTPEEFPGTGIGLAIVKRIVDKFGGRVWAEGVVGQGATFHFALPAATAQPDPGAPA